MGLTLRLHRFLDGSRANGPGARAVVWVQGCSLACPGCFNPQTHPPSGGRRVAVDDLFGAIQERAAALEGLTLSGGEPLQQLAAVTALAKRVKTETRLSVLVFTGFTWEEAGALTRRARSSLLDYVDVLIAGPYDRRRHRAGGAPGSTNQTVHLLTDRYTWADFRCMPPSEVILTPAGEVLISGTAPPRW